jgi:hypothetical protein
MLPKNMSYYIVRSPILLLNFNRPELTARVFEKIRSVQPPRLYLAVDGPRKGNSSDTQKCKDVKLVLENIDWDCEVKTLFRDENLGCKKGVSSAIDWFFENENEGIILEDDCLPAESFFYFCDEMLDRYREDERISLITGTNLQNGIIRGEGSYYFSQYSNIWGWASWKRTWANYDSGLTNYTADDVTSQLKNVFNDAFLLDEWLKIFNHLKAGEIDTWDYQLNFITFFQNGLCVTPNVNLISNIGFGDDATHVNDNDHNSELPIGELWDIAHPRSFIPQKEADYYFLNKEFNLDEKWHQFEKDKSLRRRIKRWFKKFF